MSIAGVDERADQRNGAASRDVKRLYDQTTTFVEGPSTSHRSPEVSQGGVIVAICRSLTGFSTQYGKHADLERPTMDLVALEVRSRLSASSWSKSQ